MPHKRRFASVGKPFDRVVLTALSNLQQTGKDEIDLFPAQPGLIILTRADEGYLKLFPRSFTIEKPIYNSEQIKPIAHLLPRWVGYSLEEIMEKMKNIRSLLL